MNNIQLHRENCTHALASHLAGQADARLVIGQELLALAALLAVRDGGGQRAPVRRLEQLLDARRALRVHAADAVHDPFVRLLGVHVRRNEGLVAQPVVLERARHAGRAGAAVLALARLAQVLEHGALGEHVLHGPGVRADAQLALLRAGRVRAIGLAVLLAVLLHAALIVARLGGHVGAEHVGAAREDAEPLVLGEDGDAGDAHDVALLVLAGLQERATAHLAREKRARERVRHRVAPRCVILAVSGLGLAHRVDGAHHVPQLLAAPVRRAALEQAHRHLVRLALALLGHDGRNEAPPT